MKLVNPANKRKYNIIVVGSGLAGASPPRRSANWAITSSASAFRIRPGARTRIAAQGGINAAKNYQNDGDCIYRLFYDTVKGGDFRAREANVYRLAQISVNIIDQCVAQGVPFAREYGGTLANRSFGGAQVSRTFYARGQTGQQLLLGAYQALERQVGAGQVQMFPRTEMLDLIVIDGKARGIVTRNLVTGEIESHLGRRGRAGDRRIRQRLLSFDQRQGLEHDGDLARLQTRRAVRQSLFHADSPDLHSRQSGDYQSKLTLMSRVASQRRTHLGAEEGRRQAPSRIRFPEDERDYYLERRYPSFGNLVPRDVASRDAKAVCDEGRGVGPGGLGVYLDFAMPSSVSARRRSKSATAICSTCTSRSRAKTRTKCRCGSIRPSTTRWADSGSTTT